MNGYYPEYFEEATERFADDARPGEHPRANLDTEGSAGESLTIAPTAYADPVPAPFINPDYLGGIFSEDATTEITVAADAAELPETRGAELHPDANFVALFTPNVERPVLPADAIAVYAPWHLYGGAWGIYVSEPMLTGFTAAIAALTDSPIEPVAPLALRQILEHEWTHFAFEVAGTEIEDVLGRFVYSGYVRHRFGLPEPDYSSGPLEEIVASWNELMFAKGGRGGFRKLRPRGYTAAVRHLLDNSPPGYRDWRWMHDWDDAKETVGRVVSRIADTQLRTYRWARTNRHENEQVPVYWVGSAATAAVFGGFPKSAASPTIRRLRKWLTLIGARELRGRGKGSHQRWELPDGTRVGFATSARFLLRPEASELATALGLGQAALYELVARMEPLGAPTSRR